MTQASRRSNVALYFVDARGLEGSSSVFSAELGRPVADQDVLPTLSDQWEGVSGARSLADETGGFSIRNTNALAAGLERIARESEAYYLLGYQPRNAARDGKFRKIEVKVARRGVDVRARRGYYAPGPVLGRGGAHRGRPRRGHPGGPGLALRSRRDPAPGHELRLRGGEPRQGGGRGGGGRGRPGPRLREAGREARGRPRAPGRGGPPGDGGVPPLRPDGGAEAAAGVARALRAHVVPAAAGLRARPRRLPGEGRGPRPEEPEGGQRRPRLPRPAHSTRCASRRPSSATRSSPARRRSRAPRCPCSRSTARSPRGGSSTCSTPSSGRPGTRGRRPAEGAGGARRAPERRASSCRAPGARSSCPPRSARSPASAGMSLDGAAPGEYELVLQLEDEITGQGLEVKERFRVVDAAP